MPCSNNTSANLYYHFPRVSCVVIFTTEFYYIYSQSSVTFALLSPHNHWILSLKKCSQAEVAKIVVVEMSF